MKKKLTFTIVNQRPEATTKILHALLHNYGSKLSYTSQSSKMDEILLKQPCETHPFYPKISTPLIV